MEKISGIIGSTPRLKSADLQAASAIRPGMPSFGRPVGESTIAHRKDLTTAQKANMIREQMSADKKQMAELRSVERMSDQFFMKQGELNAVPQVNAPAMSAMPVGQANEAQEVASQETNFDLSPEEMKNTPKGSYLDRSV